MTLEEAKLYLRIDGSDEDLLITSLIKTSQELVEGIIRKNLTDYETLPETIKQAMLYSIATMYESRQVRKEGGISIDELVDTLKKVLFAYREERW